LDIASLSKRHLAFASPIVKYHRSLPDTSHSVTPMTTEAAARVAADALASEHGLRIGGRLIDGDREPLPEQVWMYNAPLGLPAR
jgi:hypothetical protein